MRADRPESEGPMTMVGMAKAGEGFGEVPLLNGFAASAFRITAVQDSVLVRFSEQDFWSLLACCPEVRKIVLADSAVRVQGYQVEALHREKLVSLAPWPPVSCTSSITLAQPPNAPPRNSAKIFSAFSSSACATAAKPKPPPSFSA